MREKRNVERERNVKNERSRPLFGRNFRERREKINNFLLWSKLKCRNTWVPQAWVKFAHSFKYVGTPILRYTIIKYHFLSLGKIIY